MYIIGQGHKVRNVKDGEIIKTFNEGETLPADYIPPIDYIEQGIVVEIKKTVKSDKKEALDA